MERGFVILLIVSKLNINCALYHINIMIGEGEWKQTKKLQGNEAVVEAILKYITKMNWSFTTTNNNEHDESNTGTFLSV